MSIKEDAYRYAVKNAFEHAGKSEIGPLIGKLKALHKDTPVPELMPVAIEVVKKVNGMTSKEIEEAFNGFQEGYELKPKPEREGLPELDWADKEKVITRYAPNPNGPFHLGNARAAYLSYAYAEKYGGKFILRFEDTDPKIKKPIDNPEKVFREDLTWLGIKIGKVFFASDRMETYYSYMRKLLEQGNAYVCKCESESWRELIKQKKACEHREQPSEVQLKEFEKMVSNELKEGQAVLRIKTDLEHKDTSVRDWWLARIVDNPDNPRIKGTYHVWPSYMFQSGIDDHEMGITFILRGQEHSQNQTKQEFLYNYLKWDYPNAVHFGRLKIGEMVLSTSKIKEGIENEEYTDWDDIRLGTIKALRRRGFKPEALHKIIIDSGLTTSDANISMEKMGAYNKELIQEEAERTTYIIDPIKLEVHLPEAIDAEKEGEKFSLEQGIQEFMISESAIKKIKDSVFRLRNIGNVKVENKEGLLLNGQFVGKETTGKQVVQWLRETMDLELLLPNGQKEVGAIEKKNLKKGQYLYLEKKGYCIIDSIDEGRPKAWFCHE
ncbi:MAG: glutamate--tRNA ligase [Candidatus Diapherotrites archaeon]|uniref:Glutamate--tRNA ligase n=1 Tax=Candidatus Iainarchaeum sp. TaxID=3101447 RepID=A0A2D6LPA2_9ARCH|nr:glutamate--tRNA ligase [Candidatus Diapherotrites archaeon]|tara:strand:+ start:15993 stop:17642 length:1650 start_codon:yes stop_codon:yes gene_type:complete